MELFRIGSTDYTNDIVVPSYEVNSQDIYDEWKDANKIKHRHIFRQKISGSFIMKFKSKERYIEFIRVLEEKKTIEGYIPITVYSNNTNKTKEINAFITIEPANEMPLFRKYDYDGMEVTIEER